MSDIREILSLSHKAVVIRGYSVLLRRPSLLDLVQAIELNQRGDTVATKAWLLHRHLLDADGNSVFPSASDAMTCPAAFAAEAITVIEGLYNEGSD